MARDVNIRITATDSASPVFKTVGQNAATSATQIEQGNEKASRSYDDLQKRATAVGAGIGAVVGAMSLAGTAAYNQNREIDALTRVYGKSADELIRYTNEIQRNTNYSNDQARQAALISATLVNSYGLQTDQVEKLIARSADLATVYGITLADAVQRTSSAIRGEAESAELLGITLNDNYVAAQAAARGMTGWTTTMTDAEKAAFRYQLILEQTSSLQGTAAQQADTARGKMIDLKDSVQDNVAAFGDWLGPMGEALSSLGSMALVLPVVTGLVGKMGAAFAASGIGLGALGPLALVAGGASLAYGYSQDSIGTTATNKFWNEFFLYGSKAMNIALPGSPFSEKKYTDQMAENSAGSMIEQLLRGPSEDQSVIWDRLKTLTGVTTGEMSTSELIQFVVDLANRRGVSVDKYVGGLAASNSEFILDPVTNTYLPQSTYAQIYQQRTTSQYGYTGTSNMNYGALGAMIPTPPSRYYGDVTPLPEYIGPYQPAAGTSGGRARGGSTYAGDPGYRAGGVPFTGGGDTATGGGAEVGAGAAENITRAIKEQSDAYYGLATAQEVARQGLGEFKAVQDSLITDQGQYTGQLGEYGSQLNYLENAKDLLNKKQEDGIALTKEETQFLDDYGSAHERLAGGVDDATFALGQQAIQYADNMEKGDELNRVLEGNTEATGDLVTIIEDLILSMDNVPEEVRTRIELDRIAESQAELQTVIDLINQIEGEHGVHFSISADGGGVSLGNPNGPTISPDLAMHGMTAYANGGTVYDPIIPRYAGGGTVALVGERGPEMVWLPRGSQVTNTEATKSRMQAGNRQSRSTNFYGPVTLQMNTPDVYDALASDAIGGSR